jgi:hypothetical protein
MEITINSHLAKVKMETQYVKLWIEDGILHGQFAKDMNMNLEIAKQCVETRVNFTQHTSYPFLIDLRNVKTINKEAREYLGEEGSIYIKAGALLINSFLTKTLGNFFLAINTPKAPTKLFDNETKAIEWLKQFNNKVA